MNTIDAATNRLTTITDAYPVALASYGYDARGNMASRVRRIGGTAQSLTYTHIFDRLNRLATTYRSGDGVSGEELTTYDGHGRRTANDRRTSPSVPVYNMQMYSRAGELLYEEDERSPVNGAHPQSSNGKRVRHIYLGGSRIARQLTPIGGGPTQTLFAHTNPIRTTSVETNEAGQVVNTRQRLAPYGAPYSGEYHDRPGFTGHATDDWTELTYAQQRYYDPIATRFLSVDPVDVITATGDNFNRYWYANNNPYAFIDPDGREVQATFNLANGTLAIVDVDTGASQSLRAESGGKPFGAAIPLGRYDILDHPNEDFFRLEPKDSNFGDDVHDASERSLFRLHKPGRTIGCIAAVDEEAWDDARDAIRSTSTSAAGVDSKSKNPFKPDTEQTKKFGEPRVIRVEGRIDSARLKSK